MAADVIEATESTEATAKVTRAKKPQGEGLSGKMVKLTISKDGSKGDVPVGLNGNVFLIKRGVEVVVPVEYMEVLQNAIETHKIQDKQTGEMKDVEVQSYPFSAVPA